MLNVKDLTKIKKQAEKIAKKITIECEKHKFSCQKCPLCSGKRECAGIITDNLIKEINKRIKELQS